MVFKSIISLFAGRPAKPTPRAVIRTKAWCDFDIVGEASYQGTLEAIYQRGGWPTEGLKTTAVLRRDHGNRFDDNAVCVSIDGKIVGYLARAYAQKAAAFMRDNGLDHSLLECPAYIRGGFPDDDGDDMPFGVKLGLVWPLALA